MSNPSFDYAAHAATLPLLTHETADHEQGLFRARLKLAIDAFYAADPRPRDGNGHIADPARSRVFYDAQGQYYAGFVDGEPGHYERYDSMSNYDLLDALHTVADAQQNPEVRAEYE